MLGVSAVPPYSLLVAWQRVHKLPSGAAISRTWLASDGQGRQAVLREVPDGSTPTVSTTAVPGLVQLREVVVVDGRRFGVWDFVEGESLHELSERIAAAQGRLPLGVVVRIVVDAARALLLVTPARPHGGLSDQSLLLTREGRVLVMDVGCPRGSRFVPGGAASFANDVFALGAVLHAALTGFGGVYADAVAEGLQLPPPSQLHDECTPAIDDVVLRALSRDLAVRQPDLELLADELEAVLGEAIGTAADVAACLSAPRERPGPPVPDLDPGPASAIDEATTGEHPVLAGRDSLDGPPAGIPPDTNPGLPPDAFAAVVAHEAPARIPGSTQPGSPDATTPAARLSVPDETMPQLPVPTPRASVPPGPRPSMPVVPAVESSALPQETQPRLQVPRAPVPVDTQPRLSVPAGIPLDTQPGFRPGAPEPAASAISHAKLEWAQGQTRVPTPPLGTPVAAADDEAPITGEEPFGEDDVTTTAKRAESLTSHTAPELGSAPSVEVVPPSREVVPPGSNRALQAIAVLLILVAVLFAAAMWRARPLEEATTRIAPAGAPDAGAPLVVTAVLEAPVDAGVVDEPVDAGADEEDEEDAGVEALAESEVADGGPADAGQARVTKKKPVKRKRRR